MQVRSLTQGYYRCITTDNNDRVCTLTLHAPYLFVHSFVSAWIVVFITLCDPVGLSLWVCPEATLFIPPRFKKTIFLHDAITPWMVIIDRFLLLFNPEKERKKKYIRYQHLVLGRHGLASLELLKVPLASAHVVSVGLEALCEVLGIDLARGTGGRGDSSVGVHGLLVLLLVLRSRLLLLRLSGSIRRSRATEHGLESHRKKEQVLV